MYAFCVYCPMHEVADTADEAEQWAADHELMPGRHSVKVEGYDHVPH